MFATVINTNILQTWLLARAATVPMKRQAPHADRLVGKIVQVSSARWLLGHLAEYTAYFASNSAVDGIRKALGCELGPTDITLNAIAPTILRSPQSAWMFEDTERAEAVRNAPMAMDGAMQRWGCPGQCLRRATR